MTIHLAFDVYGTLVDHRGMEAHLGKDAGEKSAELTALWRQKQLEFAFRRGLMRTYRDFGTCTRQALRTAFAVFDLTLSSEREQALMEHYLNLPAFADAEAALKRLARHPRYAFSNGSSKALRQVLGNAGLLQYLDGLVSVEDVKSFKPDPAVYTHARRATGAMDRPLCLVSSNAWDVIGARAAGLSAIWVRRDPLAVFDDWDLAPSATIGGLDELEAALKQLPAG